MEVEIFGNNGSQEKKTDVLNEKVVSEPQKSQISSNASQIARKEPLKDVEHTNEFLSKENLITSELKSDVNIAIKPATGLKMSDINAIRESIKKDEQTKAEARKNISIELVKEIWQKYSEYNPSKSVQSALNLAVLSLSGQTISGKVPTQVSKDMILQETALLDKLRNELGISNLIFEIEVDKSLFPDFEDNKPVQAMTQREKYLLMLEKNPSLGSFTKKFGLKLDTEV